MKRTLPFVSMIMLLAALRGGTGFAGGIINLSDEYDIEVYGKIQMWNTYTRHAMDETGQSVDDRWDLFFRRGRLGFRGRVRDRDGVRRPLTK